MPDSYSLPEYTVRDIDAFLEQKACYLADPSVKNKQHLAFAYERAYTSVKHLVVVGLIPQSEMWRIVHELKSIPETAA